MYILNHATIIYPLTRQTPYILDITRDKLQRTVSQAISPPLRTINSYWLALVKETLFSTLDSSIASERHHSSPCRSPLSSSAPQSPPVAPSLFPPIPPQISMDIPLYHPKMVTSPYTAVPRTTSPFPACGSRVDWASGFTLQLCHRAHVQRLLPDNIRLDSGSVETVNK